MRQLWSLTAVETPGILGTGMPRSPYRDLFSPPDDQHGYQLNFSDICTMRGLDLKLSTMPKSLVLMLLMGLSRFA